MKKLLSALCFLPLAFAQTKTTTVTLTLNFPSGVFQDICTHWLESKSGTQYSLASDVAIDDATIVLGQAVSLAPGTAFVIDGEPMAVSAPVVNSAKVPVVRNLPGFTAAAHVAATSSVAVLTYPTPLAMMAAEVLRGWANGIVVGLASQGRSAMIPQLTGSMTVVQ